MKAREGYQQVAPKIKQPITSAGQLRWSATSRWRLARTKHTPNTRTHTQTYTHAPLELNPPKLIKSFRSSPTADQIGGAPLGKNHLVVKDPKEPKKLWYAG